MKDDEHGRNTVRTNPSRPYRVRLPGFVADDEAGLGTAITRVTSAFGIKPCEGCKQRAARLDHHLVVTLTGSRVK